MSKDPNRIEGGQNSARTLHPQKTTQVNGSVYDWTGQTSSMRSGTETVLRNCKEVKEWIQGGTEADKGCTYHTRRPELLVDRVLPDTVGGRGHCKPRLSFTHTCTHGKTVRSLCRRGTSLESGFSMKSSEFKTQTAD